MSDNRPHYLYRCYDKDGDLLYIGCTYYPKKRIAEHRRAHGNATASRLLAAFMIRYEVTEPYPNRESAREAEAKAIRAEEPLLNYQHSTGVTSAAWMTHAPIATYLIERGRRDLAMELACECWSEAKRAGNRMEFCTAHRDTDLPIHPFDDECADGAA